LLYEDFQKNYTPNAFETIEENYIVTLLSDYLKKGKLKHGYRSAVVRDEIMAKSIIYLTEQKPNEKFIIWAHNEHIAKARNSTFIYPMGGHLKKYFGTKYKAIAFSFYFGEINTYNVVKKSQEYCVTDTAIKNSIEAIASGFNGDLAYINFENSIESNKLLGKKSIRAIGDRFKFDSSKYYYTKQKLYKGFNGLIFTRKSDVAHKLTLD
jgi:erythromycin esterase